MVEMPMMPTQPTTEPAVAGEATVADAPQGAFEEMLARRLGRQLVGRHAAQDREEGDEGSGRPSPWMPPAVSTDQGAVDRADDLATDGNLATFGNAVSAASAAPAVPAPDTPSLVARPMQTAPVAGAVQPPPVKIHVSRPGLGDASTVSSAPVAEPGTIQPGPVGDVWTHPSGIGDLQLTRSRVAPAPVATEAQPMGGTAPNGVTSAPEPPVVHWNPAPARAAMAAAANRDLELEIVSQMTDGSAPTQAKPQLEVVPTRRDPLAGPAPEATAGIGNASESATPAPVVLPHATTGPHSTLIDRVLNAVEMQQHLPPPRAISVEIPEMEGLRLLVTMRMDGSVHVTTPAQAGGNDQAAPLLQAVADALAERGFDTATNREGRHGNPEDHQEPPIRPKASRFRRSASRSGLRI